MVHWSGRQVLCMNKIFLFWNSWNCCLAHVKRHNAMWNHISWGRRCTGAKWVPGYQKESPWDSYGKIHIIYHELHTCPTYFLCAILYIEIILLFCRVISVAQGCPIAQLCVGNCCKPILCSHFKKQNKEYQKFILMFQDIQVRCGLHWAHVP